MKSNKRRFYVPHALTAVFIVVSSLLPAWSQSDEQSLSVKAAALPENITFWSDYADDVLAQALVDRMTDEELLSQILMFGWAGAEPSNLLKAWVSDRGLGSVKVFGWNTANLKQLASSIKEVQTEASSRKYKIPLFVATDQEGGWIRHVKGETSVTPGNMAIGSSGYPYDAYYSSYYINREIKALGINMNFAPTVDLYSNYDSTVIGPRSFGESPSDSGILGEAFSQGSIDAGVIPTAKHFPGHGDTGLDSHGKLPEIQINMNTLENRELVPFKTLIKAGIPSIMSGHLSFPLIEPDGTPASLSKFMLTDLLRDKLGYKGLVITDDITMNGATEYAGSLSHAVTLAIEAGNDIVLSSTTAPLASELWTTNIQRMRNVPAFRNRVKDSAYNVIYHKLKYFKSDNAAPLYPDETKLSKYIPDKEGQAFFLDQACRSVCVYKKGESLPYHPAENEKILITGPFSDYFKGGTDRYPNAKTYTFSYELSYDESNIDSWDAQNLVYIARGYDTIIITVYDWHTANIAKRLRALNKKVIIFSVLSPVFVLDGFEWVDSIICGYSYSSYSFSAMWGVLNGEFEATGTIPLDLKK
ncbi:MAG: glycoside hydrolase family 3 protein [Treponema sp.]|nr:glycoside hydrolase family 3 protein [Treponema sp.]MBQ4237440.1 glycoside hydrolase family 3 protein [Treponema sp.]MBQ5383819.1 glycoside hydrolase family 3 protein [Treponema sp.]